jgi:hypothetical protein
LEYSPYNIVMYADDGIIYSDEPIPVSEIFDKPMA